MEVSMLEDLRACDSVEVDEDHDWGYQLRLVNTPEYCGKLMVLTNKEVGSMHYHEVKTETFVVLSGEVCVVTVQYPEIEEDEDGPQWSYHFMSPGDTLTLGPNTEHKMWATVAPSVVLEVSTHDEDSDTYRVVG